MPLPPASYATFFYTPATASTRFAEANTIERQAAQNFIYQVYNPLPDHSAYENLLSSEYVRFVQRLILLNPLIPSKHIQENFQIESVNYNNPDMRDQLKLQIAAAEIRYGHGKVAAIYTLIELHRNCLYTYFSRCNLPERIFENGSIVIDGLRNPDDAVEDLCEMIGLLKTAINRKCMDPLNGARLVYYLYIDIYRHFQLRINNQFPLLEENHGRFPGMLKNQFENIFTYLAEEYPPVIIMTPATITHPNRSLVQQPIQCHNQPQHLRRP